MQLIDDIIRSLTAAGDQREPIADVLRRCLVLAYKLKNDALKAWLERELTGYVDGDALPPYRRVSASAKGNFVAGFAIPPLNDQPLSPGIMKPEHRHWASEARLTQPIAAYENLSQDHQAFFEWPSDLVVHYQSAFIKGFALKRAGLFIPASVLLSLVDTVRTKLLAFALDIQGALPADIEDIKPDQVSPATVARMVNVAIFGGNNVVGDVAQFSAQTVNVGNIASLKAALTALGISSDEIDQLECSLKEDETEAGEAAGTSIGRRAWAWAKRVGPGLGGKLAEEGVKQLISHYLGA